MNITFRTTKLQKLANNYGKLVKQFGPKKAKHIVKRLNSIKDAINLEDLRNVPGNYHELKADRKGQWACSTVGQYRIIFTPNHDPIPINEHGQYVWIEIISVDIADLDEDYHGK